MGKLISFILFMNCIAVFGNLNAHGSSFFIKPFNEFAEEADAIVLGSIQSTRTTSGTTEYGDTTIYTFAEFKITEALRGSFKQDTIWIRKTGGTHEGLTVEVPGSPNFIVNEESVYFLGQENKDDGSYPVIGMELGKLHVSRQGGSVQLTGGILSYPKTGFSHEADHNHADDHSNTKESMSLDELKEIIHAEAPQNAGQKHQVQTTNQQQVFDTADSEKQHPANDATDNDTQTQSASTDSKPNPFWFKILIGLAFCLIALGLFVAARK